MMARVRPVIAAAIRGVDVVGPRVDVHEHRAGPQAGYRSGRGKEGERGRDHLVIRSDPDGHQRDQQSIRARRDPDAVGALAVGGDFPLQGFDFRAEDEDLRLEHPVDRGAHLVADRAVLGLQVEQGDRSSLSDLGLMNGESHTCLDRPGLIEWVTRLFRQGDLGGGNGRSHPGLRGHGTDVPQPMVRA